MRTLHRFRYALGALVFFPVAALLASCACSAERRIERAAAWITDDLDLNKEQKAKLDGLVAEIVRVRKEHKSAHPQKWERLESLLRSERLSDEQIDTAIAEKQQEFGKATAGVKKLFIDFHASLTAAQKEKLVERLKKFRSRFES